MSKSINRKLILTLKIPDFIANKNDQIYAGAFDRKMIVPSKFLYPPNIYLDSTYKLTNNNETEIIGSINYNIFKLETRIITFESCDREDIKDEVRNSSSREPTKEEYETEFKKAVEQVNSLSFTFYKNPNSESDHMSRIERGFRRKISLFNKDNQAVFYTNNTITKTYILNQENDTDSEPIYRKLKFNLLINSSLEQPSSIYIGGGTIGNFKALKLNYTNDPFINDESYKKYIGYIYVVNKKNVKEKEIKYWRGGYSTKLSARENDVAFKVFMDGNERIMSQGTAIDNYGNEFTLKLNEFSNALAPWFSYNRLKNVLDKRDENMNLINSDITITIRLDQ